MESPNLDTDCGAGRELLTITDDMLVSTAGQDERIDFERGMNCLPWVTCALVVLNVLIFGWELASADRGALIESGALVRGKVVAGEAWRLLTAMFLHADLGHLVGNCAILYIVGMACEHAYGSLRTALVYLGSGVCGGLLSMAYSPGPSIGASGAVFGLTGCAVAFFYRYRGAVHLRDKRIGLVLLIWAGYSVVTGFLNPWIDNFAHLGGLAAGALLVLPLRLRLPLKPSADRP